MNNYPPHSCGSSVVNVTVAITLPQKYTKHSIISIDLGCNYIQPLDVTNRQSQFLTDRSKTELQEGIFNTLLKTLIGIKIGYNFIG